MIDKKSEDDYREPFERLHPNRVFLNFKRKDGKYNKALELDYELWQSAAAHARQATKIPEGWQLVPMEATPEMIGAAGWANTPEVHKDYQKMLAAAPKPQKIMSDGTIGWQPIETAPKDGTNILVYTAYGQCEVYWGDCGWEQKACIFVEDDGYWNAFLCVLPTHWMPLPAPPQPPKETL